MTVLPEIASLWIGARLSWLEQLCLKSFADAGHSVTLYSYAPIENVPEGVDVADAQEIFPAEPMLRHVRTGSPAIHADMWRLHLLKKTNKIWVDADMYCYRPFDFAGDFIFGWEKKGLVCNAVLGLPQNSDTLNGLLEFFEDEYAVAPWLGEAQRAEQRAARDAGTPLHITEQPWGFTGPASVTWFLQETGEIRHAEPTTAFYPIPFRERNHMIRPRFDIEAELPPQTRGIHFWARRMKPRLQEKENNRPRAGSFLAKLIEKHEIEPEAAPIPAKPVQPSSPIPAAPASEGGAKAAPVDHLDLLLSRLNAGRLTRIVDVGGYVRTMAPYGDLANRGGCDVRSFGPLPEGALEPGGETSDPPQLGQHALGDGSEEQLLVFRDKSLSSIFRPYEGAFRYLARSRANVEVKRELTVQTKRLDDLDDLEAFDVLKIDAQGAEVKILRGGAARLKDAVVVMPEVRFYQLYDGEPMFGGIDTELRRHGFQLHKILAPRAKVLINSQIDRLKRPLHRNQVVDGVGVYIRDPGRSADWSDEQLKHLAIAAAAVFESHDLALYCLDQLVARKAVGTDLPAAYLEALPERLRKA